MRFSNVALSLQYQPQEPKVVAQIVSNYEGRWHVVKNGFPIFAEPLQLEKKKACSTSKTSG
jgi:hypothetical protein